MLPESVIAAWRSRSRWARADRLFIVWSVVAVVFFSISKSKRADYILTVIVALGALTARVFALAIDRGNPRAMAAVLRGTMGLAWASALAAGLLGTAVLKPELVGRLARATSEGTGWLETVYLPAICVLIAIAVVAAAARWRRDARLAFATFVLLPSAALVVCARGLERYADVRSTRALAGKISALPSQAEIACFECFPSGLPFYLKRCVTVVSNDGKELASNYIMFMLRKTVPWPSPLVPVNGFDRWLGGENRPVYVIARASGREALGAVAARRGVALTELAPGWWGALLPAPGGP